MRRATFLVALALAAAESAGAGATFTKAPSAERAGDRVKITYTVSSPTDVEVAVLDARGEVVRHLAAGVLGKNSPAPLKPEALSQSLEWDGSDDAGKEAAGGPFKVRVGLGLTSILEDYMFDDPGAMRGTECLAVDREGNLYHSTNAGGVYAWNAPGMLMRVYDRQGKYLRTIVPFPANTPFEKLKGTGAFQADGQVYPVWHDIMKMRLYPGSETYGHGMVVTSKARIYKLVNVSAGYQSQWALRVINTDGSIPSEVPILGPVFAPRMPTSPAGQRSWIRVSSDEKWAYASGLATREKEKDRKLHAVYRAPLDAKSEGEVFLGSAAQSGDDERHFNQPKGVTTDGKGLLYVADFGNDRIQVFKESDGSLVGSVPVKGPTSVQVHPTTGVIYVLTAVKGALEVVRLSGLKNTREMARVPVGRYGDERFAVMVLDASAEPPVIWCGGSHYHMRDHLLRLEDKGESFGEPRKMASTEPSAGNCEDLLVDRARDELYVKPGTEQFARVDLKTGKMTRLPYPYIGGATGTQLAISPDGNLIYAFSHLPGKLRKFDRDFKPVPFEAVGKNELDIASPMNFSCRGLAVGPNGDVYLIPAGKGKAFGAVSEVQVYGPDGKRKGTAIWRCSEGATGPRFDRQGNIYLVECIKEPGKPLPDWFAGRLPAYSAETRRPRSAVAAPVGSAAWMYASILKFPPAGGVIWYMPDTAPAPALRGRSGWGDEIPADVLALPKVTVGSIGRNFDRFTQIEVQGALWYYYGTSPFTDKHGNYDCNCQSARFDVDDYGRVFFPDVGRFRVGVLDTNGNLITAFGRYGNRDSAGPKSAIPQPEIAFAYPYTVAVSRTHVYVGDLLNGRIARLRLAHQTEETAEIR